jgi:hypothetical protein
VKLFTLQSFCAHILGYFFTLCIHFDKTGFGHILGHFFINSSGHPVSKPWPERRHRSVKLPNVAKWPEVGFSLYYPGANSTTSIYNVSVVNFNNATGSLARLKTKKYYILKNALAYYNAGVVCSCM